MPANFNKVASVTPLTSKPLILTLPDRRSFRTSFKKLQRAVIVAVEVTDTRIVLSVLPSKLSIFIDSNWRPADRSGVASTSVRSIANFPSKLSSGCVAEANSKHQLSHHAPTRHFCPLTNRPWRAILTGQHFEAGLTIMERKISSTKQSQIE